MFHPTESQIRLAEAVLVAMAHESLVRPIVEAYEKAILERHQFRIAEEWVKSGARPDIVILDRSKMFLLSKPDADTFRAECIAARDAAGLKVDNPECCPLMVAEDIRIEAEVVLLAEMAKAIPELDSLATRVLTMDHRAKAIDLVLQLVMPSCRAEDEILHRYPAAA